MISLILLDKEAIELLGIPLFISSNASTSDFKIIGSKYMVYD